MGIFDSIGDWIGSNKGWLEPVGNAVGGYAKDQSRSNTSSGIADIYQQIEQNRLNSNDQYNQWVYQNNLAMAGQAAANSAAAQAAAGARAAAARATEANRQAALKVAYKAEKGKYDLAKGYLDPYVQAGHSLLPEVVKTYRGGLDSLNTLNGWFMRPDMLAKTQGFTPAAAVAIPLPERLQKGGQ